MYCQSAGLRNGKQVHGNDVSTNLPSFTFSAPNFTLETVNVAKEP